MGHDKRHYPCICTAREERKTKRGFVLICKACGHTFKEVVTCNTVSESLLTQGERNE